MDWIYETGREEPEILGSGSRYYDIWTTTDEQEALKYFYSDSRTCLIRYKYDKNRNKTKEWYETISREWIPN